MSNLQLYLAIGIPSFTGVLTLATVVLMALLNRADINRLSDKIDKVADGLKTDMNVLKADMNRMSDNQHKDALMLQGYMIPLHERMSSLEK